MLSRREALMTGLAEGLLSSTRAQRKPVLDPRIRPKRLAFDLAGRPMRLRACQLSR